MSPDWADHINTEQPGLVYNPTFILRIHHLRLKLIHFPLAAAASLNFMANHVDAVAEGRAWTVKKERLIFSLDVNTD